MYRPEPQDGFTKSEQDAYESQFDFDRPDDDFGPMDDEFESGIDYDRYPEYDLDIDPIDLYGGDFQEDQPEWM
jgi:hypothetical protein